MSTNTRLIKTLTLKQHLIRHSTYYTHFKTSSNPAQIALPTSNSLVINNYISKVTRNYDRPFLIHRGGHQKERDRDI